MKILDPICDMIVDVDEARDAGLTLEMPDREYAFCSPGCQSKFAKSPDQYRAKVDAWLAGRYTPGSTMMTPTVMPATMPAIDAGMREWYVACRCCLSEHHPEVVDRLDAEKARGAS